MTNKWIRFQLSREHIPLMKCKERCFRYPQIRTQGENDNHKYTICADEFWERQTKWEYTEECR